MLRGISYSEQNLKMSEKTHRNRRRYKIFPLIVVLLAVPATLQARSRSHRKIAAHKAAKVANEQPLVSPDFDPLTRIAEKQQNLQNQLVILSAMSERVVDELNRGSSTLVDQTQRLGSSTKKDKDSAEVLMIEESTRRLLRFVTVLLIMLCGAVVFLALQLKNAGLARIDRQPIDQTTGSRVPTEWKGGLTEESARGQLESARFLNLLDVLKEGK
jgi:hypothetical protein